MNEDELRAVEGESWMDRVLRLQERAEFYRSLGDDRRAEEFERALEAEQNAEHYAQTMDEMPDMEAIKRQLIEENRRARIERSGWRRWLSALWRRRRS